MPIFGDTSHRIADWWFAPRRVTLRFRTDPRTARFAVPLVEKLLADNRDGATYRSAIAHWVHSQRPPLEYYLGSISMCRIDGPLQDAPVAYPHGYFVPLGGLIETPGATVHLSPFQADALRNRIRAVIEGAIVGWTKEHRLYDIQPVDPRYERGPADAAAKAQIANWKPEGRSGGRSSSASPVIHNIAQEAPCCPDPSNPSGTLCDTCKGGPGHD